jgi:predicted phage terminase large subunit-like protein
LWSAYKDFSVTEWTAICRGLCCSDLYWLLRFACNRADVEHEWLFERCREVQAEPDGRIDLWAREHFKSSIITFALTLQDILNDPEVTIGIFSHTRPIAKGFLRQIKRELEANDLLKDLFPDVLWRDPEKQAPKWSEDDGIVVRRSGNPKESTVEAWGLVDGQPTGKHFRRLVYDDVVTRESVTTPDMIAKTMSALELSYNLGSDGGARRFVGTRYHYNDAYRTIKERGTAIPREHPGREGGEETGTPVLWSEEKHQEKRRDMGPYTYGAQILLNPKGDALQTFQRSWLRTYRSVGAAASMNKYLLVDAANEKRKTSDYTAMWVIGLGADQNFYALEIVRDRLSLTQRADRVFELHRKWRPLQVRYEKYGLMADTDHIRDRQERENYRFALVEVGGQTPKNDRIKRLIPMFEQGRFYLPESQHITTYQGEVRDMVRDFVEEEFAAFPVGIHDDMLDSLARIAEPDLPIVWPKVAPKQPAAPVRVAPSATSWMAG